MLLSRHMKPSTLHSAEKGSVLRLFFRKVSIFVAKGVLKVSKIYQKSAAAVPKYSLTATRVNCRVLVL